MNTYQKPTRSDWILAIIAICGAAILNRVLSNTTGLPFSDFAVFQTILVLVIFTIDRVYTKLLIFLAVYACLMLFIEEKVYGLVFSCVVFGVVLYRVFTWRHYHRSQRNQQNV